MFTQPRNHNNKTKPALKNFAPFVIEQITPSQLVSKKQRDDEDKREAYARSESPQNSFVQYFRSHSDDKTKRYGVRYRSRKKSRNTYYNRKKNKNRYRSTCRDRFCYDKTTTPPQYTGSRYDNYKVVSRSYSSSNRSS